MAAATALVSGYPDHPPILFLSLLSFLSPLAGSHRERGVIAGSSALPHPPVTISFQVSSPLDLKSAGRE
ncbi:hypothetical protein RHGRI_001187 [Rhododendron griersonianum]|uniref:Uncharacterized protein n=1 Tax=Rhododendron griersonianum TaxID=479676 RepID=A0AAV6LKC0_9ERIC|nr:hypothetical protein RHGRI_001187 [Rhododendron griersonianum]